MAVGGPDGGGPQRRLAGRNLTRQEWHKYLPADEPYRVTCRRYRADGRD